MDCLEDLKLTYKNKKTNQIEVHKIRSFRLLKQVTLHSPGIHVLNDLVRHPAEKTWTPTRLLAVFPHLLMLASLLCRLCVLSSKQWFDIYKVFYNADLFTYYNIGVTIRYLLLQSLEILWHVKAFQQEFCNSSDFSEL